MTHTSPALVANSKANAPLGTRRPLPPAERFWVRYSPHHELPLSLTGSFLAHALGVVLLSLLLGGVLYGIGGPGKSPELGVVQYLPPGQDGGQPNQTGAEPTGSVLRPGDEALQPSPDPALALTPRKLDDVPALKPIPRTVPALDHVPNPEDRLVREIDTNVVLREMEGIGKEARERIHGLLEGQRKGSSSDRGDPRAGVGPGLGGAGPPGGKLSVQARRQQRWVLVFNTRDGQDYLRQLQHLGAILAIPQPEGQYLVYRDLSRRPAVGRVENIGMLNRIYWVDDKPQSVHALAESLGLAPPPSVIAAFFPEGLEQALRQKEARHYNGPEANIEETRFQIVWRGGRYEPLVVAQRLRR